jgi:hypothetical protein
MLDVLPSLVLIGMIISLEIRILPVIGKCFDQSAIFTPAKAGAAIGGINNPIVYTFFLFSFWF